MIKYLLAALLILGACAEPHGNTPAQAPNLPDGEGAREVRGEMIAYHGGTQGHFAQPAQGGPYPGVVMIHEWWGLNDNIKAMADRLAAEGYMVLAVDLFNGTVATTPDEARRQVGAFDQEEGLANMRSAAAYLRAQGAPRLATLGWCFGGAQSLQLGLNDDVDATVIYYGQLVTDPARLEALEQPVLGIFGEEDQSIPPQQVHSFDAALEQAGVEHAVHLYPGVGHAFANPSGDNYAPAEAQDAWEKTVAFLAQNLG